MGRSLLVYNLYPRTVWRERTRRLLSVVPHDDVVVHVSMPPLAWLRTGAIRRFVESCAPGKVRRVLFSANRKRRGETVGFERIRREVDLAPYDVLTYVHSKGTSRRSRNTAPVADWIELMRWFVVERHDLCLAAFDAGMWFHGVNLSTTIRPTPEEAAEFPDTRFIYSGNFVSVNLAALRERLRTAPCRPVYYGLECFWGSLGPIEKAATAHQSGVDHYGETYPPARYRST